MQISAIAPMDAALRTHLSRQEGLDGAGTAGSMVAFYSGSAPAKARALKQVQLAMLRGKVIQNRPQGTLQWAEGKVPLPLEALTGEDWCRPDP